MRPQTIFVSATPGPWEMERTGGVFIEQVIRPTGLIDPVCIIRPVENQVDDLIAECRDSREEGPARAGHHADQAHGRGSDRIHARGRHPRALPAFRHRHAGAHRDHPRPAAGRLRRAGRHQPAARGPRHSRMRAGRILDADKEGFLRSQTSLVQTIGRAARNIDGRVILYADKMTELAQVRDRRDRPPPREAAGLQRRPRHHAGNVARASATSCRPSTSATTTRSIPASPARRHLVGPQSARPHRRSGEAHARRRRRPRIRGGRAASATRSGGWRPLELEIPTGGFAEAGNHTRAATAPAPAPVPRAASPAPPRARACWAGRVRAGKAASAAGPAASGGGGLERPRRPSIACPRLVTE